MVLHFVVSFLVLMILISKQNTSTSFSLLRQLMQIISYFLWHSKLLMLKMIKIGSGFWNYYKASFPSMHQISLCPLRSSYFSLIVRKNSLMELTQCFLIVLMVIICVTWQIICEKRDSRAKIYMYCFERLHELR